MASIFAAHTIWKLATFCIIGAGLFLSASYFSRDLHHHTLPLDRSKPFPKKIWQTWKVDPTRFEETDMERSRSWMLLNPQHRYEVLTDGNALAWVQEQYGPYGLNRPDIVDMYGSLTTTIIKADLIRYLVMYVEGGVYTDIDVEAVRPVSSFIPPRYPEADVDMVIGIETDQPAFKDHPVLGSKSQSFVQWTFMCKSRLPVMMRLIENVMASIKALATRQGVPISEIVLSFDDVLSTTGPSQFTNAVLAEMSQMASNVSWDMFHGLFEARLVARTLVLTSEAFAAGSGHSNSGNGRGRGAMVQHHYHASHWPSQHHRQLHPVFGNVEKCNWDRECVDLWDVNTAFFASLPGDEQLKMIELNNKGPDRMPDEMEDELSDDSQVSKDDETKTRLEAEPEIDPSRGIEGEQEDAMEGSDDMEEMFNMRFGIGDS